MTTTGSQLKGVSGFRLSIERLILDGHAPFNQQLKLMTATGPMYCIHSFGIVNVLGVRLKLGRCVGW